MLQVQWQNSIQFQRKKRLPQPVGLPHKLATANAMKGDPSIAAVEAMHISVAKMKIENMPIAKGKTLPESQAPPSAR